MFLAVLRMMLKNKRAYQVRPQQFCVKFTTKGNTA